MTKIVCSMKQYYKLQSYYTSLIIDKLYSLFYYTTLIHYLQRWHCVIYYSVVTSILIYIHLIIYGVIIDGDYYTPSYLLLLWYMWFCLNHDFLSTYIYTYVHIFSLLYTVYTLILSILFYTVFCCKEQGGCCTRYTVWTYRSYLHSIHTSKLLIRAS